MSNSPAEIIRNARETAQEWVLEPECAARLQFAAQGFQTTTGLEANTITVSFSSTGEITTVKVVHEAV